MNNLYPPIVQVDDSGNVIGPVDYKTAHANNGQEKGIRHPTANIFVFETNKYDRLLITRRGGIDRGGKLNVCIGGPAIWIKSENRAQTLLENGLAEIYEEIFYNKELPFGLRLEELTHFNKDLRPEDPEHVYLFSTFYPGPFSFNPEEISECYFISVEELDKNINFDLRFKTDRYVKSARLYLDKFLKILNE